MRFLLTTEPGIEDVAAAEVRDSLPTAQVLDTPDEQRGLVFVDAEATEPFLELTTIDHVIEVRAEGDAATLDDVRRAVARVEFSELAGDASFRVTSNCPGEHAFTRRELEGAAGAVLQRRYGARVDLTGADLNVRVDLYGSRLVAGVQRTDRPLGRRLRRAKALRTSIKPTTAAAMVRLAGAHRGAGRLIDPLCGAGTIPVEAKRINPRLDVYACDWDRATAEVAEGTVANHALEIDVRVCDSRSLRKTYPEPFDFIVTDPPYGVRLGKQWGVATLYRELIPSWEAALADDGRIVVALVKFKTFLGALENSGLQLLSEREVGTGELQPRIVVLGRSC